VLKRSATPSPLPTGWRLDMPKDAEALRPISNLVLAESARCAFMEFNLTAGPGGPDGFAWTRPDARAAEVR